MKEVLDEVRGRWYFYRNGFRGSLRWLLINIGIIFLLIAVLAYLFQQRGEAEFYATSSIGGINKLHALEGFQPGAKNPVTADYTK